MGPCHICGKAGGHGTRHPTKKTVVWSCYRHKASLPKREDRDYEKTEAEDREAAMRAAATRLGKIVGKEAVAGIGRAAFEEAFYYGLDAYFAMREEQLEP